MSSVLPRERQARRFSCWFFAGLMLHNSVLLRISEEGEGSCKESRIMPRKGMYGVSAKLERGQGQDRKDRDPAYSPR